MDIVTWLRHVGRPSTEEQQQPHRLMDKPVDHEVHKHRNPPSRRGGCLIGPKIVEAEAHTHSHKRKHHRRHSSSASTASSSTKSSSSPSGEASISEDEPYETFQRRPRRKTRPEIYEPGSNARKRRSRPKKSPKRRQSKKQEKYHRTVKARQLNNAGHEMLSRFSADNVPSERLTLKPQRSVGLFCNGKVSSPKRGRGLPDLTFSDMKFLNQHRGGRDDAAEQLKKTKDQETHVVEKSNHTRSKELEVVDIPQTNTLAQQLCATDAQRTCKPAIASPPSPKRVREPPYSRQTSNESRILDTRDRGRSATALSWQESARESNSKAPCFRGRTAISVGMLQTPRDRPLEELVSSNSGNNSAQNGNRRPTSRSKQGNGCMTTASDVRTAVSISKDVVPPQADRTAPPAHAPSTRQDEGSSPLKKALRACDTVVPLTNIDRRPRQQKGRYEMQNTPHVLRHHRRTHQRRAPAQNERHTPEHPPYHARPRTVASHFEHGHDYDRVDDGAWDKIARTQGYAHFRDGSGALLYETSGDPGHEPWRRQPHTLPLERHHWTDSDMVDLRDIDLGSEYDTSGKYDHERLSEQNVYADEYPESAREQWYPVPGWDVLSEGEMEHHPKFAANLDETVLDQDVGDYDDGEGDAVPPGFWRPNRLY